MIRGNNEARVSALVTQSTIAQCSERSFALRPPLPGSHDWGFPSSQMESKHAPSSSAIRLLSSSACPSQPGRCRNWRQAPARSSLRESDCSPSVSLITNAWSRRPDFARATHSGI